MPTNTLPMNPSASASGGANGVGGSGGAGAQGGNSTGNTGGGGAGGENTGGQGNAGENTGGATGEGGNAGNVANGGTAGTVANGGGSQGGEGPGPGYMPCPTNGDPCAVLPLGDSITEGCCNFEGGYRAQLFRRAVMDGKNLTFTGTLANGPTTVENQPFPRQHEGHGGFTIDGISGQVTEEAIADDVPHIVLLMIGTNDLNGNVDVNQAPTRLDNLVDQIMTQAPDALVVVATIIPMVNGNGPRVPTYNAAIADLVDSRAAQGEHIVLADNYAAFTADDNYSSAWMSDTLHPNTAGYVVLGDSFYDVIGPYLPDAP